VPVVASVAGTPTTIHCDGAAAVGGSAGTGAASDTVSITKESNPAILVNAFDDVTSRS
jgi:hypothetical protein